MLHRAITQFCFRFRQRMPYVHLMMFALIFAASLLNSSIAQSTAASVAVSSSSDSSSVQVQTSSSVPSASLQPATPLPSSAYQATSISSSGSSITPSLTASPSQESRSSSDAVISPTSSLFVRESSSLSVAPHPCDVNNGGCVDTCEKEGGNYKCVCDLGYQLASDKHDCIDVDECNKTDDHNCTQKCVNTVGSYACACEKEFKLDSDGLSCSKITVSDPPTSEAQVDTEWTWIILGIVIGLVALTILIMVLGAIAKARSKPGKKETVSAINAYEMGQAQEQDVTGTTNQVEVQP